LQDKVIEKYFMYIERIKEPVMIDVMYRKIDYKLQEPLALGPDTDLEDPGLCAADKKGNVTLANAPGTGVADDKAVYTYMPEIIKYYLNEEPILNNVHTYHCSRPDELKYVLDNIPDLVIKPVDEAGGYGISIGNKLSKGEIEKVRIEIKNNPRKWVAQPIMSLSVHPTYIEETESFEQRHVDLRTFTVMGKDKEFVLKGGLTRVALKRGNLIVNSSQGGGSKDTWVLKNKKIC